jgi:hypothetical protein
VPPSGDIVNEKLPRADGFSACAYANAANARQQEIAIEIKVFMEIPDKYDENSSHHYILDGKAQSRLECVTLMRARA